MTQTIEITQRPIAGSELAELDLFRDLPQHDLDELARQFVELQVTANQAVYTQGESAAGFYIVRSGALAVFRDAVGQPVQLLARLHEGDFFGEIALFGTGLSTASVRASSDSRLLRIGAEGFLPFVERHPEVQLQLQMAAARRHSDTMAAVLETGRRREVRIRCRQQVSVVLPSGGSQQMMLENLSLGGLCLSGVPTDWQVGATVSFGLCLREGELPLEGSVRWIHGESAGLSFIKRGSHHDMLIQMAIRLIHESAHGL